MTSPILVAALVALALPLTAGAVSAGPIERACLQSDRQGATRAVCACIQQVADDTLKSADQRRVAKFFNDPEKAQKVRLSDTKSDDAFWARYREFGSAAEAQCTG